ncbi:MAG TPA: UvrD-helicase domain-containing protein, partial [Thermodesulfobacteriota bacterium]|nr:UvrD-helicase domain-containing protein [Thermodesulfobacteriota bacterium]
MLDLARALNPAQYRAVSATEGPVLVLAGAGSGKTRVLTYRIAHLVASGRARPDEILAVTFTNKAAGEMRARLAALLGPAAAQVWVGTFHAAALRILREQAAAAGLPAGFVVYDEADQEALLRQACRELQVNERILPIRQIAARIDQAKNDGVDAAAFAARPHDFLDEKVARVYARYQALLAENGALDFGDLLLAAVALFERRPDLLERYRRRARYLHVDEYQDTNRVQYRLVRLLAGTAGNLCVVGDDDQAIYRWRGADIRNILDFERDFPGATVVKLEQNYRSTQVILDAAGAVVAHNAGRTGKRLWTARAGGEPVRYYEAADEADEAAYVVETLLAEVRRRGLRLDDAAVFYRINAQSRALEEELRRRRVPYLVVGGVRFYDRAEVKDLLAYLRVLVNPADSVALRRILNVPPRGIGRGTLERLAARAAETGRPLWDAVVEGAHDPLLSASARRALAEFVDLVERLGRLAREAPAGRVLEALLVETGYAAALEAEGSLEAAGRLENVRALLARAHEAAERGEATSVAA